MQIVNVYHFTNLQQGNILHLDVSPVLHIVSRGNFHQDHVNKIYTRVRVHLTRGLTRPSWSTDNNEYTIHGG